MRVRFPIRHGLGLAVAAFFALSGASAFAQGSFTGASGAPAEMGGRGGGIAPGGAPGASLVAPGGGIAAPSSTLVPPPPAAQPAPMPSAAPIVPAGQVALYVNARLSRDQLPISGNVVWRVFPEKPDEAGAFKVLREATASATTFLLPPGNYVVHASFGYAQAIKLVHLRSETVRETFDIAAGGIRIEGRVGDTKIPAGQIHFSIYRGSQFEPGDKRPLAQNVQPGDIILVSEGTHHVVSHYGEGNAVVRSDIKVESGKLTDVMVTHRAAVITLKLVEKEDGEAVANTQWSVLTPGGDIIKESSGAFPRVVLAEGDYRVIARNEGRSFEHDFKVTTGIDAEIAVLAR